MLLHQLEKPQGSTKQRKRVGRGPGSGTGKTAGRGQRGQKARSGCSIRRGFEGGQTPLHRRLPKFGFTNVFRTEYTIVNLSTLDSREDVDASVVLTKEVLRSKGVIRNLNRPVKLLAQGELSKPLIIEVDRASGAAVEKVKAAGGEVIILNQ
ncbi:50S ribosomal protein L15 [Deltaproteobacteria bacterium TL4]